MLGTDRDLVFFAGAVFVACLPILLRLLENIHRSRSLSSLLVWLYTCTLHTYTNRCLKSRKRVQRAAQNEYFYLTNTNWGWGQSPLYVYVIEISSTCAKLPAFQKFNFIYDFSTTTKLNAHKIWLVRIAFHAHAHTASCNCKVFSRTIQYIQHTLAHTQINRSIILHWYIHSIQRSLHFQSIEHIVNQPLRTTI